MRILIVMKILLDKSVIFQAAWRLTKTFPLAVRCVYKMSGEVDPLSQASALLAEPLLLQQVYRWEKPIRGQHSFII